MIPKDHYFFLGDNRDASNDSRYIGPVPRRLLIGRANHIVMSRDVRRHPGKLGAALRAHGGEDQISALVDWE